MLYTLLMHPAMQFGARISEEPQNLLKSLGIRPDGEVLYPRSSPVDEGEIRSRIVPALAVGGAEITTIEGIAAMDLHPVQKAWMEPDVPQCGYCQTGQIMQAIALLKSNGNLAIRISMS
jgi:hypothetical protein